MKIAANADALMEWADADGAVFDELVELLEIKGAALTFGARVGGAGPSYWHKRDEFLRFYRAKKERLRVFTMTGDDCAVTGRPVLPAVVDEIKIIGSGLRFVVSGASVLLSASSAFRGKKLPTIARDRVVRTDPRSLTVLGSARITAKALAAAGDVYENWIGSGQPFGSAFVKRATPIRAKPNAVLDCAWLVTGAGEPPNSERAVWVAGHASGGSSYAELTRKSASDALWHDVLSVIGGLPGIDHATSGSALFTGAELATWLASRR